MITKEQLQAMSDFEVNKALSLLLDDFEEPPADCVTEIIGDKLFYRNRSHGSYVECHKGYCEEPNDIMPLAFDNHLTIHYVDNGCEHKWFATKPYSPEHFHDVNPLRAISCCLILVLQGKKE